jgi:hypothetical protein
MSARYRAVAVVFLFSVGLASDVGAQRPKPRPTRGVSPVASAAAVVSPYEILGKALAGAAVRDDARAEILRQLAQRRPIAFVNGYWVTPITLSRVLDSPGVAGAFNANGGSAVQLGRLRQGLGFVFTADQLATTVIGDMVRDLTASLGAAALAGARTDAGFVESFLVGFDAAMWPNYRPVLEWIFGEPEPDPDEGLSPDDPNADPDNDGNPNVHDDDDDGDGTPDDTDAAPYDDSESICGHCPGGRGISFAGSRSQALLGAVVSVFSATQSITNLSVPLGAVTSGSSMRLVFAR